MYSEIGNKAVSTLMIVPEIGVVTAAHVVRDLPKNRVVHELRLVTAIQVANNCM